MWLPGAVSAVALGYATYSAAWPSAQRWGECLWRLPRGRREIALTFDDGPGPDTERFLDLLESLDVEATFFLCGQNVQRNPGIARSVVLAGHAIGNHTHTHPRLPFCSANRVRSELSAAQDAIMDATGASVSLFRPPYGLRSPALRHLLPEFGLMGVHWTVIGNDWKWKADSIASRVVRKACDGAIVCLHDAHPNDPGADRMETLRAVGMLVPQLRAQGYRFVALQSVKRESRRRFPE